MFDHAHAGCVTLTRSPTLNYKKIVAGIASIVLLSIVAIGVTQPMLLKAVRAKFKSTDHFLSLAKDPRVRYEKNAEDNAAAVQEILDQSQKNVETALHAQFKKPVYVHVCASQQSFNEYVFLSKTVKGAVYWEKLFLSPAAFTQDRRFLGELTTHELTHYLFNTHLGEKAHVENVPLWFREGIAVYVANGAAGYTKDSSVYTLISYEESETFLSGDVDYWFVSKNPADAVKNGRANWLLYRVGAMLVHYMHDSQPAHFDKLIRLTLSGTEFDQAVQLAYGKNIELIRKQFAEYLAAGPGEN